MIQTCYKYFKYSIHLVQTAIYCDTAHHTELIIICSCAHQLTIKIWKEICNPNVCVPTSIKLHHYSTLRFKTALPQKEIFLYT